MITRPYGTQFRFCCEDSDGDVAHSVGASLLEDDCPLPIILEPVGPTAFPYQDPLHLNKVAVTNGNMGTLQAAVNAATPGTWIAPSGTYTGNLQINGENGTAANKITIQPDTLHGATIVNTGLSSCIWLRNSSHIDVIGLRLDGGGTALANVAVGGQYGSIGQQPGGGPCQHIYVAACDIFNAGQEGIKAFWNSTDLAFEYNTIRDLGVQFGNLGEGIYVGSSNFTGGVDSTLRVFIQYNDFFNLPAEAIDLKGAGCSDVYVAHNAVHDCVFSGIATGNAQSIGAITIQSDETIVVYNRVWNITEGGPCSEMDGVGIAAWVPCEVRHNLIWDIDRQGIEARTAGVGQSPGGTFTGDSYLITENTTWNTRMLTGDACDFGDEGIHSSVTGFPISITNNESVITGNTPGTNNLTPVAADFINPITGSADAGDGPGSGFAHAATSTIPDSVGVALCDLN